MTSPFQECETSFLTCANDEKSMNDARNLQAFRHCIKPNLFPNLSGCTLDCAPTFNMMKVSEEPISAFCKI